MKQRLTLLRRFVEILAPNHALTWAPPWHGERTSTQHAFCTSCGMQVDINMDPLPNHSSIHWERFTPQCKGEPREQASEH